MTWLPFVEQTVAMVRDHEHNYRRGPGYYQDSQGTVHETYWEIDPDTPVEPGSKVPYRIEFVGVMCDPGRDCHLSSGFDAATSQLWPWREAYGGRSEQEGEFQSSHSCVLTGARISWLIIWP